MTEEVVCIRDRIIALPNYKERQLAVRVMIEKGLIYNNGTLNKPIFLFDPGVCDKHPRGCSLGGIVDIHSFYK